MSSVQEAFKKYDKSRQETIAYHGGTCNQHDFEAGYKAAIAATADQFRQAKVKVLREAAEWFEAYGNKGFSVINLRHNQPVEGTDMKPVLCVSEKELRRMNEGDKWIKAWLPPTTMAENVELYTADQLRDYGDRRATAERDVCAITAVIHSQYPITTEYDRGFDAGSKRAADAIRARGQP